MVEKGKPLIVSTRAGCRSFEPALRAFVEVFSEPVLQVPFLPDIMTRSA